MRCALVLPLLAVTSCVLTGCGDSIRAGRTLNLAMDHVPGSTLAVNTRNGAVAVFASAEYSRVEIESKIQCAAATHAEAERRLTKASVHAARDASGRLVIRPVFPDAPRSGDGASFTIRLPDAHGLVADTSNGSVTVVDVNGPISIDTSNGRIAIEGGRGTLLARTSNGSVSISDHEGRTDARTSNGAVRVAGHLGPLAIRTSNGSITVLSHGGPATLHTSNGAVQLRLRPDQPGPIDVTTSNGSIVLSVGPAFAGELTMRTSNSPIRIADDVGSVRRRHVEKHRARLTIGQDGSASRAATSNGSIMLSIEPERHGAVTTHQKRPGFSSGPRVDLILRCAAVSTGVAG